MMKLYEKYEKGVEKLVRKQGVRIELNGKPITIRALVRLGAIAFFQCNKGQKIIAICTYNDREESSILSFTKNKQVKELVEGVSPYSRGVVNEDDYSNDLTGKEIVSSFEFFYIDEEILETIIKAFD